MNKLKTLVQIAIVCISMTSFAQNPLEYSGLLISPELKENANAVIKLSETTIEVTSFDRLKVTEKRVVTVLNKLGRKWVHAYQHYNNDTKIRNLSATIYDNLGKRIKRYAESDFNDVSAVDDVSLYSDAKIKFLEYTPTSYPYTVVFETTYENSTTAFIPSWNPIEGYSVSVQKSTYRLLNPTSVPYRKKESNFKGFDVQASATPEVLVYEIKNQPAIKFERTSVALHKTTPTLQVALDKFALKGVAGTATNWKELGLWLHQHLFTDKNQLSPATISKVKQLVKGIESDEEKVKKIYEYVQNKTRYISVQVDIGGWEPIAAMEVDKVSYGDCKGLSNYTKALLDAVGIPSYHTLVYAKNKRDITKDFTSLQGNHMILNVPLKDKELWLECTNQEIPFGFLGDFTDDRDVLVVTPKGGIIKRTPSYKDNSLQETTATIALKANGNVTAHIERSSTGVQYNSSYQIEGFTSKELDKYYKERIWDYNNNLEIVKTQFTNDKKAVKFTESIDVTLDEFATVRPENYLVRVNVFNRFSHVPKRYRKRKRPLKLSMSYTDKDSYTYTLPEGYKMTTLPTKINLESTFGRYTAYFEKIDDTHFRYHREMTINEGVYPKEDYKAYRKFRKSIAKYDGMRIELIRQ